MADEQEQERRSLRRRLAEVVAGEEAEVIPSDEYGLLEAEVADARVLRKDLELLAWTALDYMGGSEQDLKAVERRKLVQRSRVAWQVDPQVGAATELMNDFALGRGVPKPKARDPKVQEVLDEAWDDEDNELVLTGFPAQLQLSTDLSLQANLFVLVFTGDDGKVKLAMLDHDTVENVVRDPDNRRRILWYIARTKRIRWDYQHDTAAPIDERDRAGVEKVLYYQHWKNEPPEGQRPPGSKIGKGRVFHVAVNRTGEMAFGHPPMHRMLRWATAFNNLMEARVDMARAAAAFIMKRKVKGTPNQVQKMATKMLTRRSQTGYALDTPETAETGELQGPRAGSILSENEAMEHESFSLDSNAQNANTDAQMLRSQISSGSPGRWPQHYLGDIGSSNLATASAMELVPMKAVENRQEVLEQLYRWFCDLVIENAVEKGRLLEYLTDEELEAKKEKTEEGEQKAPPTTLPEPQPVGQGFGEETEEAAVDLEEEPEGEDEGEESEEAEEEKKRDLSYDFSLPSPIRKMLGDLMTAVQTIASTFDPNNTNTELSRTLLAIALGEGLEMQDPGEVVEKVFPPGYKDPAMAAFAALKERGQPPPPGEQPPSGEEPREPTDRAGNPYMARTNGNPYGSLEEALIEALTSKRRDGETLEEALMDRLGPEARKLLEDHIREAEAEFEAATKPLREMVGGNGAD